MSVDFLSHDEWWLVFYPDWHHRCSEASAVLDGVFGPVWRQDELPCEAGPFGPGEAAVVAEQLDSQGLLDEHLIWQSARQRIAPRRADEALVGFPGEARYAQVQLVCLPRCWVVLAFNGWFIPPGSAWLVDHASGLAFARRYSDIDFALRVRGYATPRPPTGEAATQPLSRLLTGTLCKLCGRERAERCPSPNPGMQLECAMDRLKRDDTAIGLLELTVRDALRRGWFDIVGEWLGRLELTELDEPVLLALVRWTEPWSESHPALGAVRRRVVASLMSRPEWIEARLAERLERR